MEKTISQSLAALDKTISSAERNICYLLNLNDEQRKILFEQFNLISDALSDVRVSKTELNKKLWDLANNI